MKIILLTSSLGSGGAERVACTLTDAWASRNDDVILMPTYSGKGACFYKVSSAVRIIFLADLVSSTSSSFFNQLVRLKTLRRFLAEKCPDVIVSFLSNVNVATIIAAAGLKIPVVICERTDPFIMPVSPMLRFACRATYQFADALIVQTKAVAEKYRAAEYPIKHIQVIPNPVADHLFDMQHKRVSESNACMIAVGRLDEGKQFDLLIRVFSNLALDHSFWTLRIYGDGPLRSVLQQQIIDYGLESRITLMGLTTNIWSELAQADVYVMTSRYEGFPNTLLEAMAVGLPCVTFDCPSGPREMTMDGVSAMLVPLNDEVALGNALDKLMTDGELRHSLGAKARESVKERYELSRVLQHWDELFRRIGVIE